MLLQDTEIRRYCAQFGMVTPFREELLNPASLDLRLGTRIMIEQAHTRAMALLDISHATKDSPYYLAPGEFILAETQEEFHMPEDISAVFCLKSTRAREGYEHSHAGFAECGWNGSRLTLELKNNRRLHPLPLYPDLLIGQMLFILMLGTPELDYAKIGHYNGQPIVTPSWEN
jgi:dCTP deaminase